MQKTLLNKFSQPEKNLHKTPEHKSFGFLLFLLFALSFTSTNLMAARDLSIQDRLQRLEQQVSGVDNSADLVIEMQKLQQQVDELRGQLEEINYKIKSITDKQKLLYLDMDSRLSELEKQSSDGSNSPQVSSTNQTANQDTNQNTNPVTNQITTSNTNQTAPQQMPVDTTTDSSSSATINSVEAEQNDYDVAFSHLRAGRFNESARQFESFIYTYPESQLLDNAYYWLGESFYVQRQYPQALSAFQTLVSNFPNSRKQADAMLKVGYTYFELGDIQNAKKHLSEVVKSFPNSSVSRLAGNRLNQINRD